MVILLIYCPVFTFISGKMISLEIYNNKSAKRIAIETKEINNNSTDTLALKFLGFLGDKFIISSLNNKRVFVLNQSAYDMIEISDSPYVAKPKQIIEKEAVNDIVIDTTLKTIGDTTK